MTHSGTQQTKHTGKGVKKEEAKDILPMGGSKGLREGWEEDKLFKDADVNFWFDSATYANSQGKAWTEGNKLDFMHTQRNVLYHWATFSAAGFPSVTYESLQESPHSTSPLHTGAVS